MKIRSALIALGLLVTGVVLAPSAASGAPAKPTMIPANQGNVSLNLPRLRALSPGATAIKFEIGFYGRTPLDSSAWITVDAVNGATWNFSAAKVRPGFLYVWSAIARDAAGVTTRNTVTLWVFTDYQPTGTVNYRSTIDVTTGPFWNSAAWNSGLTQTDRTWLRANVANLPDPPARHYSQGCVPLPSKYASLGTVAVDQGVNGAWPSTDDLTGTHAQNVALQAVIREINAKEPQLLAELRIFGGQCYRQNGWSNGSISLHSWGLATDIQNRDASGVMRHNIGTKYAEISLVRLREYMRRIGYIWGAPFTNNYDATHFEASRELVDWWKLHGQLINLG